MKDLISTDTGLKTHYKSSLGLSVLILNAVLVAAKVL